MSRYILAIDQGTTSSRAIIFAPDGTAVAQAQQEFTQHYPANGWVQHDAEEIWSVTAKVCCDALGQLDDPKQVLGIGITNQRETTIVWDKTTGKPIYPAIVWQDRRTADHCRQLVSEGRAEWMNQKTGLLPDSYFSATKIAWILDNVPNARARAKAGELAFGTVDTWLIWKLTGGKVHATDATNASRTLLFNIHTQQWDAELLNLFDIPAAMLPKVCDCAADFGIATQGLNGLQLPIAGVAGDQQAAMVGQACFDKGMVKSTYGTGCFALMNLGANAITSRNRLLTTVAYRLNGQTTYALEGAIFIAGAAVQWLRDQLGIIRQAAETEELARSLTSNRGVYLVPAFTGLGAPHWDPDARGTLVGLTRDTGRAELARAALEAVCYQTRDLIQAMAEDANHRPATLRVDGGMIANNWLLQALADIADVPVEKAAVIESSALGAARLAGLQLGIYQNLNDLASYWKGDGVYRAEISVVEREQKIEGWRRAVRQCREV
ncbi:MAG: glycerol kinase GlpK [Cellvibrionaceae bacterium]|nr:glycerol kinase GlpK [Cellvibrionaceae bacterium]